MYTFFDTLLHKYERVGGGGGLEGLRTQATVYSMQPNGINEKITMHSYCRLISNYTHNTWPPIAMANHR